MLLVGCDSSYPEVRVQNRSDELYPKYGCFSSLTVVGTKDESRFKMTN